MESFQDVFARVNGPDLASKVVATHRSVPSEGFVAEIVGRDLRHAVIFGKGQLVDADLAAGMLGDWVNEVL